MDKTNNDLTEITKELNRIKDKIYDVKESTPSGDIFKNLIKLNNIESELYEILVLLYSNNKAELDAIKYNHLTHSSKIIDSSVSIVNKLVTVLNEIEYIKEITISNTLDIKKLTNKTSNKKLTIKTLVIVVGLAVSATGVLALFSYFLPNATQNVFTFLEHILNSKAAS